MFVLVALLSVEYGFLIFRVWQAANADLEPVTADLLLNFKVKVSDCDRRRLEIGVINIANCRFQVKRVPGFVQVWNSQNTHSQAHVSIWAPSVQKSMLSTNKVL